MKARGSPPRGKGFLNRTAAPLSPDRNTEGERKRSLEVSFFHMNYGQKLLLGDNIWKDELSCIRISRSFSGVMVVVAFGLRIFWDLELNGRAG